MSAASSMNVIQFTEDLSAIVVQNTCKKITHHMRMVKDNSKEMSMISSLSREAARFDTCFLTGCGLAWSTTSRMWSAHIHKGSLPNQESQPRSHGCERSMPETYLAVPQTMCINKKWKGAGWQGGIFVVIIACNEVYTFSLEFSPKPCSLPFSEPRTNNFPLVPTSPSATIRRTSWMMKSKDRRWARVNKHHQLIGPSLNRE